MTELSEEQEGEAVSAVHKALGFTPRRLFAAQVPGRIVILVDVPERSEARWDRTAGAALIALRKVVPAQLEVAVMRYDDKEFLPP